MCVCAYVPHMHMEAILDVIPQEPSLPLLSSLVVVVVVVVDVVLKTGSITDRSGSPCQLG